MYSPKDTGAVSRYSFELDGEKYECEYLVGNDTLHFTLNAHVSDHFYGSWNNRKYAVIIPFDKVDKYNLLSCFPEDTYFQNVVNLPAGSIIICPSEEKQEVSNNNPNIDIISYDNSITLDQAIECAILYKGYKVKRVSNNGWLDNWEEANSDSKKLDIIKSNNNIIAKDGRQHSSSENLKYARLNSLCNRTISIIKCLIDNNLEQVEIEKLNMLFISGDLLTFSIFQKKDFLLYVSSLVDKIRDEKMIIVQDDFMQTINDLISDINKMRYNSPDFPALTGGFQEFLNYVNSLIAAKLLEYSNEKN